MAGAARRAGRAALAAGPASVLFLHFFLGPEVDHVAAAVLLGAWASLLALDLGGTASNRRHIPECEASVLLAPLYARLGVWAFPAAAAAEAACVALLPAAVVYEISLGGSAAVAYVFSVMHGHAAWSNEGFLGRRRARGRRGRG